MNVIENLKQHPYMVAGGVLAIIVVIYFVSNSGGGSSGATSTNADANYATDVAAATQLQTAQLADRKSVV